MSEIRDIPPRRSRGLVVGTQLRWRDSPKTHVLRERKRDDSGWWCVGGGGLADRVIDDGDDWAILDLPVTGLNTAQVRITFTCEFCGEDQTTPGALIFGPPDEHSRVAKWHICPSCYEKITPW